MPDAYGMPTPADCLSKVGLSAPDRVTDALVGDVRQVLAAVIAQFQSPARYDGSGGTGRQFVPVTETRLFDGTGYRELMVDDIVPGTALTVSVFDSALSNVALKEPVRGKGHNVLSLSPGDYWAGGLGPYGFTRGSQNVAVAATWGFAALVPDDVYEAIRCETAYRALIMGYVPLSGIGETVTIDGFTINTSAGVSVWRESSPIAHLHGVFLDAVRRYEIPPARYVKKYAQSQRMS